MWWKGNRGGIDFGGTVDPWVLGIGIVARERLVVDACT
jgi:hypothetical protein